MDRATGTPMLRKTATFVDAIRTRHRSLSPGRALLGVGAAPPLVAVAVCSMLLSACDVSPSGRADNSREVERGRVALARYHCGTCHAIPGVASSSGKLSASLQSYGKRSYIAGRVANEPDALAQWIVDPASIVAGTRMPNMGVSPADARDMAAYLGGLR